MTQQPQNLIATINTDNGTVILHGATLEELSAAYCRERDQSGLGASGFGEAKVRDAIGNAVARVSYNGRVWNPGVWLPGDAPIFDPVFEPRSAAAPALGPPIVEGMADFFVWAENALADQREAEAEAVRPCPDYLAHLDRMAKLCAEIRAIVEAHEAAL